MDNTSVSSTTPAVPGVLSPRPASKSATPKNSQEVPSQPLSNGLSRSNQTSTKQSLADIIGVQYPPFDAQTRIARPFAEEAARDAAFEKELAKMFLDVLLKTHAWASSRPRHAAAQAGAVLEADIAQVAQTESDQGTSRPCSSVTLSIVEQTRQRLNDFVQRMRNALAALLGTGL